MAMNADCFEHSALFLLDLSAALDMIDHSSVDENLRNCIDIFAESPWVHNFKKQKIVPMRSPSIPTQYYVL